MRIRRLALVTAGSFMLALATLTGFAGASGYPPLPRNALFEAVTPRNIEQVRNRINGSADERNQIPVGTVLAYKTSAGNVGKMQILEYGSRFHISRYDLYVKFVTYRPDGSILTQRSNFLIKGTWAYDLDTGKPAPDGGTPRRPVKNRAADLWWEIVGTVQHYLDFENGATFTIVS